MSRAAIHAALFRRALAALIVGLVGIVGVAGIAGVAGVGVVPPAVAADHVVVLQYHHVHPETPASTSVTPERFAAHLEHLDDAGFRVASLPDVLAALARGEQIPDSTVCLTADDGYANLRTEALPLLQRYGWPMTVFVCTEQVDTGRPLHLGWDDLRALQREGWTIASHGTTHDHLVARRDGESEAAWRQRVRANIAGSVERLRQELGDRVPDLFAYPYGEYDPALQAVVRELGLVAFGQHSGAIGPGSDRTALPRFPVSGPYSDPDQVVFKAATLPLPVTATEPASPVLPPDIARPTLTVTIGPGPVALDQLAAYASGQGRIAVRRDDPDARTLTIEASEPLPPGRSRYNLTAPHRDGGRWYWWSMPWLRTVGGWQEE